MQIYDLILQLQFQFIFRSHAYSAISLPWWERPITWGPVHSGIALYQGARCISCGGNTNYRG